MGNAVEINNLSFTYNGSNYVLSNINLIVPSGSCVGITGGNGAGKSTLLLNIAGILNGNGEIKISGTKLSKSTIKQIRKKIGFIFENPDDQLFGTTVFEDVSFAPINLGVKKQKIHQIVQEALRKVEMEGYENRVPQHLSLGEKKRIAIASVLSANPEILLMDEPTGSLDSGLRKKFIQLIKTLKSTMIIASHDLEMLCELCESIYLIKKGKIIGHGKPLEILTDEPLMHKALLEPLKIHTK